MIRLIQVFLISIALAACSAGTRSGASEELNVPQSRVEDFLEDVTAAAQSGDVDAICRHGRSTELCESALSVEGVERSAPASTPTVHCRSVNEHGTWVVVRGQTESGEDYVSRLLMVEEADRGVVAVMPVFWDGLVTSPPSTDGEATVSDAPNASEIRCP